MTQVFLNYRAADEPFGVVLLDHALSERFGSEAVFLASKAIPLGAKWEQRLFQAVADSVALLVIIGRHWADARDGQGRPALANPDDFVRREILLAFELDKQVIPVRLGVPRIQAAHLPDELRKLADCQDIEVRFRSAQIDIDQLVVRLRQQIPALRDANRATTQTPPKHRPPTSGEPGRIGGKVLEARLKGPVDSLCFGPDNSVLAAAGTGPIRRWHLGDGVELPDLPARGWLRPRYGVRMAASQHGGTIVVRDRFSLRAVDADAPGTDGMPMGSIAYPGYLDAASSGRYAITSWATRFTLRSAATGRTVRTFSAVTTSMSADSRLLAVAHGLTGGGRIVRVHRLIPGQEADEREHRTIELHQAAGRALQIALSPDGSLLGCVTARWAGIYDVETGEPIKSRSGDSNLLTQTFPEAMGLICTPAGHLLWMSRGRVLQLRGNRRDDLPALPERYRYRRIAISIDGAFLAIGDDAGWMRVWQWHE